MSSNLRARELGRFLMARRADLTPEQVGLASGPRRRPGLRREEVAMLAGVGASWYQWIEQGRAAQARLALDGAGHGHRRLDPEGDRGGHAAHGLARARPDRHEAVGIGENNTVVPPAKKRLVARSFVLFQTWFPNSNVGTKMSIAYLISNCLLAFSASSLTVASPST